MPVPHAPLGELAQQLRDANTVAKPTQDLVSAGPRSQRLWEHIGNETATRPLIASFFWQAYTQSPEFALLMRLAVGQSRVRDMCVASSGWNQYDLIVLAEDLETDTYVLEQAQTPDAQLRAGWDRFIGTIPRDRQSPSAAQLVEFAPPEIAAEAQRAQPFYVIIVRAPETVDTVYCPTPPLSVSTVGGTAQISTVGAVAQDAAGRVGVTAALHAVAAAASGVTQVGGVVGTIVSQDQMSDSCFVAVPNLPVGGTRGTRGPLTGRLPRGLEPVDFEGVSSGHISTVVDSWSHHLPFVARHVQGLVYSKPVTAPGDSGAALVDDDGNIVGFCAFRSGFGQTPEFAAWVWADSVFKAHGLS